jgi:hypothetical protein
MRKFLSEKTALTHFIDFGGKPVFDEATVDAAIVGFIKNKVDINGKFIFIEVQKEDNVSLDFDNFINHNATLYPRKTLSEDIWSFDNPKWLSIIEKISSNGIPLSEWDININRGVLTGYNEAFIIDEEKRNELVAADPKSAEIIKPLLRGRDIKKYVADDVVSWLINTHNGSKPDIKAINVNDYFAIKNWLDSHWFKLSERYDRGETPYNLRNCAYLKDFDKPKLVWKRIGSLLRFCYDESGAYCLDSTCIATGSKVKFLAAVLNSKLCNKELFRLSPKTGTGDLIISVQALNPLRVPQPTEKQEEEICSILDKIIEAKKQNSSADTSVLEREIDLMVYALYGLAEEEIKIVEAS